MALSFKNRIQGFYLVGNPIVFVVGSTENSLINFDIIISGNTIYSGAFYPIGTNGSYEASISVSEILKPYTKDSEIEDFSQLVSPVSNSSIPFNINFTQGESTLGVMARCFKGATGKNMLRYLKEKDTDIFDYKLINSEKQFFMTTRTTGRHIILKENELYPFQFIATDKPYTFVTEYGNTFTVTDLGEGDLYAFNPEVLRKMSYELYSRVPSLITVLVDGLFVFDIAIKPEDKSPNKYIIRFQNSFAAFEQLEVTGKCLSQPEFAEDNAFTAYDPAVDDYVEKNDRLAIREIITADFGYKTLEEFLFMRDMLQSNLRYWIDSSGRKSTVRVSVENFSHDLFPTEPGSVPLKIRFVDNDTNYSPLIDESDPEFRWGEGIWRTGITNGYGFLHTDSILNTI